MDYQDVKTDPGWAHRSEIDERPPEVRQATERLAVGVERMAVVLTRLEDRLNDVLGPDRPSDAVRAADPTRATVLGGHLHGIATEIDRLVDRGDALLDRLRDGL